MDCLKPGDVAIFATPPAFRWVHFNYAIEKGLNVFMEKPVTVDGPTTRKMLELAKRPTKKNLKVGVGLMCRHCDARRSCTSASRTARSATSSLLRAYRMHGPVGYGLSPTRSPSEHQRTGLPDPRFHSFLWASGGCFSDFYIHNIDECCWMKDAWPVKAQASAAATTAATTIDQNFDTYSVEYTFADGTKLFLDGRNMDGCHDEFASYAHGTKGSAVISTVGALAGHVPHLQGPEHRPAATNLDLGVPAARAEPLPARVGRPDRRDPQRQALQRSRARRRGQPGHVDGPHGRPHRPGHHLRRDAQLRPRVRPRRRQARRWTAPPRCRPTPTASTPCPQPGIIRDREY